MKTLLTSIGIILGVAIFTTNLRYEPKLEGLHLSELDTIMNYEIPKKQMKLDQLKSELGVLYAEINYEIDKDENK